MAHEAHGSKDKLTREMGNNSIDDLALQLRQSNEGKSSVYPSKAVKEDDDGPLDFSVSKSRSEELSSVGSSSRDSFPDRSISTESPPNEERRSPGTTNGNGVAGSSNGILSPSMLPSIPLSSQYTADAKKLMKQTRPFKAYPRDPLSLPIGYYGIPFAGLSGMPGMGMDALIPPGQPGSLANNELYSHYIKRIQQAQENLMKSQMQQQQQQQQHFTMTQQKRESDIVKQEPNVSSGSPVTSVPVPQTLTSPKCSPPETSSASPTSLSASNSRKRARVFPDEQKDESYWERRRKNNEAAKRSRDARRAKEDEIAIRAAFLEQENLKLRVELAALKNETSKLRCMLYNS